MSDMVYEGGRVSERKNAVGAGWGPLLDQLDAELCALDPAYRTLQVKEKFGQLRVYLTGETQEMREKVYAYEAMSGKICEHCGAEGTFREGGWMRTLCNTCERKYQTRKRAGQIPSMES